MSTSSILSSLVRTLEHEILSGRRRVALDPAVAREFVAEAQGGAKQRRQAVAPRDDAHLPKAAIPEPSDASRQPSDLASCSACPCRGEGVPVFGRGNQVSPDYMFVCEYPAAGVGNDILANADFELLKNMLKAMGTDAASVFVTAAIKCRPPNKASADGAAPCAKWLSEQVAAIRPKCLVAMGDYALRLTTGQSGLTVKNEHGKLRKFEGVPLVPTYNPAYLNKFPVVKKDAWKDLKLAMAQTK